MIDDLKQCIAERTNQTALWQLTTPFQYKIIKDMEWKEYTISVQNNQRQGMERNPHAFTRYWWTLWL